MNMQVNTGCQQGLSRNQFGFLDTQHERQVSPSRWGLWGKAPHLPRFMNYLNSPSLIGLNISYVSIYLSYPIRF